MQIVWSGGSAPAQSIYRAMSASAAAAASPAAAAAASSLSLSSLDGGEWGAAGAPRWPPTSIHTAAALVVGLARTLHTRGAIGLINSIRSRGLATSEDVNFGHMVGCPQDRCAGRMPYRLLMHCAMWRPQCGTLSCRSRYHRLSTCQQPASPAVAVLQLRTGLAGRRGPDGCLSELKAQLLCASLCRCGSSKPLAVVQP